MNTQLRELYHEAGDAVTPGGDVERVLARATRRRTTTRVATPLATAAVVAGVVGVVQPWSGDPDGAAGGDAATADGGGFAASLPESSTLAGRTYALDTATAGVPKKLEVSFRHGSYSAYAGCNSFTGRYDISDNVLTADSTGSTAAFCPGAAKDDAWLESFLKSAPQVAVDGDRLELNNGEDDVTLSVRRTADKPLAGTDWRLDSIVVGSGPAAAVTNVPSGQSSTLQYDDSGSLNVSTQCGHQTSPASITADTIEPAAPSWQADPGCSGGLDRTVSRAFDGSPISYDIDGRQLSIRGEEDALIYVAD